MSKNIIDVTNFIWSVANLIRDHYKRSKYADVIIPFTVLRRLDCVLSPTKDEVLEKNKIYGAKLKDPSGLLKKASGLDFYNTSEYNFKKLLNDPNNIKINLLDYINSFSPNVLEIIDKFRLRNEIKNLDEFGLLYQVVERFEEVNLHPDRISNHDMGYIFESLIRMFNEQSNENPGEHFTPREIIRLMVNLLMDKDLKDLSPEGKVITVYDPACGTGGMLSIAKEHILENINPQADVRLYGQEVNPETFAMCKSDMLIKGEKNNEIKYGSSFSQDGFNGNSFDYILSNPPYGKEWKPDKDFIEEEHEQGSSGRFGAGLPRISDGQLLFLQHMISKMNTQEDQKTRIAIVFNGAPSFNGDAGSGESEIRRWIIENDWLEAIIALPDQIFYNTGISTYIWILTNQKENDKKGKIALINAADIFTKMDRNLGDKRKELTNDQIKEVTKLYHDNFENGRVQIFNSEEFGYRKIKIEIPLRMNFKINNERINSLKEQTAFINLTNSRKKDKKEREIANKEGKETQKKLLNALYGIGEVEFKDYNEYQNKLNKILKESDLKVSSSLKKAIRNSFGEKSENGEVITNSRGIIENDSDFKDYEYVPLNEDIYDYFEREVKLNLPDAWINEKYIDETDGKLGKIGYEINVNRYFFKYQPFRSLDEIYNDLDEIKKDILKLMETFV